MRRPVAQALHRHASLAVMKRGDEPAQRRQCVRHRPSITAAVHRMIERANLYNAVENPAYGSGQRRLAYGPVRAVCEHDGIGTQQVLVLAEELGQMRGPDFLLALDEDGHANRRLPLPRLQCRRVNRDSGLVIGRTTTKKTSPTFRRHEWRRIPEFVGTGRLDVMMCVEQYCRRTCRPSGGTEYRGMSPVDL